MTKREFVQRMVAAAKIAKQKGAVINTEAVIAQAALESGWGNSLLTVRALNLFGIKGRTRWGTIQMKTLEYWGGAYHRVISNWRVYPSWNECIVDYSNLIKTLRWFRDALPHADKPQGDGDAVDWIFHLVDQSYPGELKWATGPDYVNKVMGRVASEIRDIMGEDDDGGPSEVR